MSYDRGDIDPSTAAALWGAVVEGLSETFAPPKVDACQSTLEFVRRYGLRIEGRVFDFDAYSHMIDVFDDPSRFLVIMAGAQSGKTAFILSTFLREGLRVPGSFLGYFFPDDTLAAAFSNERFVKFVKSSIEIGRYLGKTGAEQDTNAVHTRTVASSKYFFRSVKSITGTEGLPMQGIFFDEVRKMSNGDIMRAEERIEAQANPMSVKVSTAGYPNSDIHAAFMAGNQTYWHSECLCSDGIILSEVYPDCIVDLKGAQDAFRRRVEHAYRNQPLWLGMTDLQVAQFGEAVYMCPRCETIIVNPRDGWWQARVESGPGSFTHSYQMSQLTSPSSSAAKVLHKSRNPLLRIDNFYKDVLGRPFLDPKSMPVTDEDLYSCVTPEARWAMRQSEGWRRRYMKNCGMGVDCQGGYLVVTIGTYAPNGKFRLVHVGVVAGPQKWRSLGKLMVMFDIQVAVVDSQPEWDSAHAFALEFRGRVFLAVYTGLHTPMVDWKDRRKAPPGQKKAGEDAAFKFIVYLHRTKILQWALGMWRRRRMEVPDPMGLIQDLPVQSGKVILTAGLRVGTMTPTPICRDVFFLHQKSVAFRKEYQDPDASKQDFERGSYKMVADHVGTDPHAAHATGYLLAALSRIGHPLSDTPVDTL